MERFNTWHIFAAVVFILALVRGLNSGRCPPIKVKKDTIIRTRESIRNGAKLLYRTDVESSRECYELCCDRRACSLGVMHYKKTTDESGFPLTKKTCFIFACGIPNHCSFMNHTGYAIIEMQRNKPHFVPHTKPRRIFPKQEKCPPGTPVAMCSDDPCKKAECPGYPEANCMPSYCGGCLANFYDVNGKKLHCKAKVTHKKPQEETDLEGKTDEREPEDTKDLAHVNKLKDRKEPDESEENVKEEIVEVLPEDTSGKPTDEPLFPDAKTEEDPHAVKQWRTWLDSRDGHVMTKTAKPSILSTNAGQTTDGKVAEPDNNVSKKPVEKVIIKKESPLSLALAVSLIICIVILIAVIIKLKCLGPKKKKKFAVDDGDYLINGMYL